MFYLIAANCPWQGKTKKYPLLLIPSNFPRVEGAEPPGWQQRVSAVFMHTNPTADVFTSTLIFLLKTQTQTQLLSVGSPNPATLLTPLSLSPLLHQCIPSHIARIRTARGRLQQSCQCGSADTAAWGGSTAVHFQNASISWLAEKITTKTPKKMNSFCFQNKMLL